MIKSLLLSALMTTFAIGQPIFEKGKSHRCDVLMIGDSNQLYMGGGFDQGYSAALFKSYGQYATGLHFAGENNGNGAGIGYKSSTRSQASSHVYVYAASDTSEALSVPKVPGFFPNTVLSLTENQSTSIFAGMRVEADSLLDINAPLAFWFNYQTFASGEGIFRPWIRYGDAPYQGQTWHTPINTSVGVGSNTSVLFLGGLQRNRPLEFLLNYGDMIGPVGFSWMRVENVGRNKGFSVHTWYGFGGQSTRDMAEAFFQASNEEIQEYLRAATLLQDMNAPTIIRICSGLNDRGETVPSINQHYTGNSPLAYTDNISYMVERIRSNWILMGRDMASLYFVIASSHPISSPNDPQLVQYEAILRTFQNPRMNIRIVETSSLISANELITRDWYITPSDHNHLKPQAYEEIASREVHSIK